jgi:hypothetical protein
MLAVLGRQADSWGVLGVLNHKLRACTALGMLLVAVMMITANWLSTTLLHHGGHQVLKLVSGFSSRPVRAACDKSFINAALRKESLQCCRWARC